MQKQQSEIKSVNTNQNDIPTSPSALQMEAVKQNGSALQYIINPSEAIQMEALKPGYAFQQILNSSENV